MSSPSRNELFVPGVITVGAGYLVCKGAEVGEAAACATGVAAGVFVRAGLGVLGTDVATLRVAVAVAVFVADGTGELIGVNVASGVMVGSLG